MAKAHPQNTEAKFNLDELFFSVTDLKGIILRGNDVFQRVSQYSAAELVGAPHNLIRHPDMPKSVFRLLWTTISQGKSIAAYVKNMAKDGSYYWVLAFVIPLGDRYLSVRMKPSSEVFKLIPDVYQAMLKAEATKGMDGGEAVLVETLKKLGLKSYQQFMALIVTSEMRARDELLSQQSATPESPISEERPEEAAPKCELAFKGIKTQATEMEAGFLKYFSDLEKANQFGDEMKAKARFFLDFGKQIKFLAMNANLGAQRLGSLGKTLSVVAGQIQKTSFETLGSIEKLSQSLSESVDRVREAELQIASARLLVEMLGFFSSEILARRQCFEDDHRWIDAVRAKMNDLRHGMEFVCDVALKALKSFQQYMRTAEASLHTIVEVNASVGIVHVTGRTEAASAGATAEFDKTFHELSALVDQSKSEIGALITGMRDLQNQLGEVDSFEGKIRGHLEAIRADIESLAV